MRMPRTRLKLRRWMVVVAVAACTLTVARRVASEYEHSAERARRSLVSG